MSEDFIKAPWSAAEVDALNRFQRLGHVHEFTCPTHHDGADRTLYATREGWRCPHCDYRQDWAHRAMLDAKPLADLLTLSCDVYLPPATLIRKGCALSTLMEGFKARAMWAPSECRFGDPAALVKQFDPLKQSCAVHVTGGDYEYDGMLCGLATKSTGAVRYVIEDANRRLFIHNAKQIDKPEGWLPDVVSEPVARSDLET